MNILTEPNQQTNIAMESMQLHSTKTSSNEIPYPFCLEMYFYDLVAKQNYLLFY